MHILLRWGPNIIPELHGHDIQQYKQCLDKELDQMYIFRDAHEYRGLGCTVHCDILNEFCRGL